ncbi:iron-sulfur cluster biosynthesis transcriptional regulator SufR [Pseudanabaena sp. PCC 6802]|uniref:iron-sulfur cluster biosynthesis transcriptional regulator SufR n=1 Tax=Pseudanabaena sp. PCC 6802 TaxID=118173 RepID=UPI000349E514|nr:iron-sulfur cluster biosynthesis transcriptional regulator SufR [Pseudanabaena sp. PCC 6802]
MKSTEQASTKQDILQYLLKHEYATAQDLADRFSISPQAIRRHLKDLEAEGLIEHELEHKAGEGISSSSMGRPQHIYKLSSEGRDRFPANYNEFAVTLLSTMSEAMGREQVAQVLQLQWQRKALEYRDRIGKGSLQERVANLAEIRKSEGYVAEWYPVEDDRGNISGYILTEYHCAIAQIAETFPSVCGHELEMFAAALEGCKVERTHWMVDGEHRCGYLIQSS